MTCIASLVGAAVASGDNLPRLFRDNDFTAYDIAEAANYFVGLGEKRAVVKLVELGWPDDGHVERCIWMALILYGPRDNRLGPREFVLPSALQDFSKKHCYLKHRPLIEVGGMYLVLEKDIPVSGGSTSIIHYLDQCQRAGVFRADKVPVIPPEALKGALDAILSSEQWSEIFTSRGGKALRPGIERLLRRQTHKS